VCNGHRRNPNDWKRPFIYSLVSVLGLALTAMGAPDYFDRKPINTKFAEDKPVVNGATFDDIRQGEAATCSLMASLSAAARSGLDLSRNIKHLGGKDYSVKLFVKGVWTEVKVVFAGFTKYDPLPNDEGEYWVALYQRAYLKALEVDCSDPDDAKWGAVKDGKEDRDWLRPSIALRTVTGRPVEVWCLDREDAVRTIKRIREAVEKRRCVVVTTKGKNSELVADKTCLVGCHAYNATATGEDWIEVRNPWGRDIHRALLARKVLKNGREIYAFKDGYSDERDDNPNDGIVRAGLDNIRFFDFAVVTADSN
jgi:hypothetical protein